MGRVSKVLIANRGEIAVRIARTLRSMGIASVAVYSDADAEALHVRVADEAVHIGPAPSLESYLDVARILEAARRTGADAIHPGFGFLSERDAFARAVQEAGLTFIGPSPEAILAMGKKREAKETAMASGVPVVPGYNGTDQDPALLAAECARIGFPVLVKASAGGGGKGMRVCRRAEDVQEALAAAKREALSAFGDDALILEKYVERPRHVEIQILGDQHGNLLHLFERECSIQRRHQKVIEETPSTALSPELRAKMGDAAVAIGKAIGYSNAGTVEFIVDPAGNFYFLEVNTRLQVEHPITECVTGLDLVREQVRVARGEALGYSQADVTMRGAALECRLYAEDPAQGFLPQSGTIVDFHVPEGLPWLRLDTGVESGSEVSIYYDPMVAKVITHGADRREATERMRYALRQLSVQGIATNREFLLQLLAHPAYEAGHIHTHFIEEHAAELAPEPSVERVHAAAVAAVLARRALRREGALLPAVRGGFRNHPWRPQTDALRHGESVLEVQYRELAAGTFEVGVLGAQHTVQVCRAEHNELVLEIDGLRRAYRVTREAGRSFVQEGGFACVFGEEPRFPELDAAVPQGGYVAPMPGKIIAVDVRVGERVSKDQRLLVMEAMKMEHAIRAAGDGVVEAIEAGVGAQVDGGQVLVVVRELVET
ncbi:MAG: acetyl-CoA carboxylase biotin carboxylase subunit [Myxococcales bacterium]